MPSKEFKGEMPFLEHIREFRKRLILSIIAFFLTTLLAFVFYEHIIFLLKEPFKKIESSGNATLFMHSILEGFFMKIKVSLMAGIVASFPVHVYNLVRFVFPGLKRKERIVVGWMLLFSTFLILGGATFSYKKIIPISVEFLSSSAFRPEGVGTLLNYGQNIFYIFQFFIFSLLLFQLPILLNVLLLLNIVSRETLWKSSRYIIVGIFIVSAFLTPPDPISQLSIALPLIILFYLSLFMAKIFRWGRSS